MSAGPPNAPPQPYITWTDETGVLNAFTFDLVKSETWNDDASITDHAVEKGANIADHVRVALDECELVIRSTNEPLDGNAFATAVTSPAPVDVSSPLWVPGPGIVVVPQWSNEIELRALAGALVGLAGGVSGPLGAVGALAGNALAGALLPGFEVDLPVATSAGLTPPAPRPPALAQVQQYPLGTDYVEATHAKMKYLRDTAQVLQVIGTKQVNFSMAIESLTFVRNGDSGTGEMLTVRFKEIRLVATQVVSAPIPHLSAGGGKPPVNRGAQTPKEAPAAEMSAPLAIVKKFAPSIYAALPPATP